MTKMDKILLLLYGYFMQAKIKHALLLFLGKMTLTHRRLWESRLFVGPACLLLLAYVASCSSCYEAHFGVLCRGSVLICPWIQCLAAGLPTKANQQSISLRCLCIDHTMSIIIPTYICDNRFYCRDPCHEKSWSWVCFPSFLSFCTIFILNYSTTYLLPFADNWDAPYSLPIVWPGTNTIKHCRITTGQFGPIFCCYRVQKVAQIAINCPIWSLC